MKNNLKKNGFVAISMIYSVFILFVTILLAVMFAYISDRKTANTIKEDIKNRFAANLPSIIFNDVEVEEGSNKYVVQINAVEGSFPLGSIKYNWSLSQNAVPSKVISSGDTVELSYDNVPGNYYLVAQACDVFDNCTVMISQKYTISDSAVLLPGPDFKTKLQTIANRAMGGSTNIATFKRSYSLNSAYRTADYLISTSTSSYPVYAVCQQRTESSVNCWYWTEAMRVKFNPNSSNMFKDLNKLITVDLGDFDKNGLTNTTDMFTGCTDLQNIKTPIAASGAQTINLPATFYNEKGKAFTKITGATESRIWLTKDLVNYKITYDLDGGTLSSENPIIYNRATASFTLKNPTKEGYKFMGWTGGKNLFTPYGNEKSSGITTIGNKIIFQTPKKISNSRFLSIQANLNATTNWDTHSFATSVGQKELTLTKDSQWNQIRLKANYDTNLDEYIYTNSASNTDRRTSVQYEDGRVYTFSFNLDSYDLNRGTAVVSNFQVEEGEMATSYEPFVDRELTVTIPMGSTGNRHYKANWLPTSGTSRYNLTIDPNGGNWSGSTTAVTRLLNHEEVYDIPEPTKEGKVFAGWKELDGIQLTDYPYAIRRYVNSDATPISITEQSISSDNPLSTTTVEYKIVNNGNSATKPGFGGFVARNKDGNPIIVNASSSYIHIFVAKLDDGYQFNSSNNNIGCGGEPGRAWLTSNKGTGKWQTYAYRVNTGTNFTCGESTKAGDIGYVWVSEVGNTNFQDYHTGRITWYLAYSNIYDITNNAQAFGWIDGNGKLTAKWADPVTLTINPSGGNYKGDSTSYTITGYPGQRVFIDNNLDKTGNIFVGWTYTGSGVFDYIPSVASTPSSITPKSMVFNSADSALPTVYNNASGNAVTREMVQDSTADGGYTLKIVTNGKANPGAGGIRPSLMITEPNSINIVTFKAKVPTGYVIKLSGLGSRYIGIGAAYNAPDKEGSGDWKTYTYAVYTGQTGGWYDQLFLYIDGKSSSLTDVSTNVTWYLDEVTVTNYSRNSYKQSYILTEGNQTLNAVFNASGSMVTFSLSDGAYILPTNITEKYGYYNVVTNSSGNVTSARRQYRYGNQYTTVPTSSDVIDNWTPNTRVTKKEGYTLEGWYTSASGGTKVFDKNGVLLSNVSGFSDSNGKWIKYDSDVTLYPHWTPNKLIITYSHTNDFFQATGISPTNGNPTSFTVTRLQNPNTVFATETIKYTDTRSLNWPTDTQFPFGYGYVRYGYQPRAYFYVGPTADVHLPVDYVVTGSGCNQVPCPATKIADALGVLSSFKTNEETNVNIRNAWSTAYIDHRYINSNTGALVTPASGTTYYEYMATDYYFPVEPGMTLYSNYSASVFEYDKDKNYIKQVSNSLKEHNIDTSFNNKVPKFIRIEIKKANNGGHDASWWQTNLRFDNTPI